MNNCSKKWNVLSFHTLIRSACLLLLSGSTLFSTQALAEQDPAGCNANALNLDIQRDKAQAVPGESVLYTITVENPATSGASLSCNTVSNTVTFTCPGPTGEPDGPATILAQDVDYLAGTPETVVGQVSCVMPNIQGFAAADVEIIGELEDNAGTNSPLSQTKEIAVNILACAVEVDKQISCDGGQTWVDQGLQGTGIANDGPNACTTLTTGTVLVRYQVRNAGSATLAQCTLGESNASFGVPAYTNVTLAAGELSAFVPGTLTPQCQAALPGEPNTATISCNSCNGVVLQAPVTASDQAALQCLTASLRTDRNVNCGGGAQDMTLVTANEDGTNGCSAPLGSNVSFNYQANNNGTAPLFDCQLVDSNPLVSATPISVGNLAPGQTLPFPAQNNPVACTEALQTSESTLGKVTLTCCTADVAAIGDCADANRVTVFDQSNVTCLAPDLVVAKVCEDVTNVGAVATINVTNPSQVALENCVATDTIYLDDATCPPTGTGTPATLQPDAPFNLAANGGTLQLSGTAQLTSNACNTVSVTCTVAGTATTITRTASDVCETPELGCITRTPGFWGTHPHITTQFLPVQVCGTSIDNVTAGSGSSAIEAMCSTGKDGKILGPQLTQLVRQCTAASLNVAASLDAGGNCGTGSSADITSTLAACCDGDSICTGDSVEGFDVGSCIAKLDAFNNSNDTLNSDVFVSPGPANPRICQDARGNNVVVQPTP